MKFTLLAIVVFLVGCSTAAIQVTETENQCTLQGALFTPTILGQVPPEPGASDYDFKYTGDNCTVKVWSTK